MTQIVTSLALFLYRSLIEGKLKKIYNYNNIKNDININNYYNI